MKPARQEGCEQCLIARRLGEAGVRLVQIRQGGWDTCNNLHKGLIANSAATEPVDGGPPRRPRPAGLLDETPGSLRQRVRPPADRAQGEDGRDHNITGYPMCSRERGVKPGFSYGSTDEFSTQPLRAGCTMDLHATLLALMGLDHESLTYNYAGRDFRLTDVAGNVVREISAVTRRSRGGHGWPPIVTEDT